jgi:hypothetical protein
MTSADEALIVQFQDKDNATMSLAAQRCAIGRHSLRMPQALFKSDGSLRSETLLRGRTWEKTALSVRIA